MRGRLLNLALQHENDIVTARQRARFLAQTLGFDSQDQTRIATAVSEIARNAVTYGGGGQAQFFIESATTPQLLVIEISDRGAGIKNLHEVLSGRYRSYTGMGRGIIGAQRLLDRFDIDTSGSGTRVTLKKLFPRSARLVTATDLPQLAGELEAQLRNKPLSLIEELSQQNNELVAALEEVESKRKELTRLNAELFDTNRGVLALYAELEEKAEHLRRADEIKSRFLSNMSHEFRTPLNSILALSRLLLDRADGELTSEQERQVGYVRTSARDLLELVNDLLDLAKVESGKTVIRSRAFSVDNLFAALRGMMRPLLATATVELIFEDAGAVPELENDEAKIAQILRNFLSNALKFTQQGEVRVGARLITAGEKVPELKRVPERDSVLLWVADTGIGIAKEDQERIFEEFAQIEHALQAEVKGTGLGLPLCRKLAHVLNGEVWVTSVAGEGSRFFLLVPRVYGRTTEDTAEESSPLGMAVAQLPLLVIEESTPESGLSSVLQKTPFNVIAAENLGSARAILSTTELVAVVLDLDMHEEDAWRLLPDVKRQGLPLIAVSQIDDADKGLALGADVYGVKPFTREWLMDALYNLVLRPNLNRVVIADDDAQTRSLLRKFLAPYCGEIFEAENGLQAQELAHRAQPNLMMLDWVMPHQDGLSTLQALRGQSVTREMPVVLCSSKLLSRQEHALIVDLEAHFLPKNNLEREPVLRSAVRAMGRRIQTREATFSP